ncbi:MAG: phosphatidylinositol mannoside acyltransferase, partial [Sciscionella sp.]
ARLPADPARLAARTGAALLPGSCWFTERGWGFRLHPPIAVPGGAAVTSATQELAGTFAADIAAHPSDWHMLQRVFLADLSPLAAEVAG